MRVSRSIRSRTLTVWPPAASSGFFLGRERINLRSISRAIWSACASFSRVEPSVAFTDHCRSPVVVRQIETYPCSRSPLGSLSNPYLHTRRFAVLTVSFEGADFVDLGIITEGP